jgi:hypothetical protein
VTPVTAAGEYRAPVRRFPVAALVLAMTIVAAGCGGDGGGDDDEDLGLPANPSATTTMPVPSTAAGTTLPPSNLTLRLTGVRLANSEESDNGMRILLPAGVSTASVTLTGLPSPNRVVSVCQARELDRRQEAATCRTPASGEAVTVTLGSAASGVELLQLGTVGTGPAGNSAALDEVTIRYAASSRELNVRLPQIAGGEPGPTFGLTPASTDGTYRATLSWTVIPVFGGSVANGQLELLEGGNATNQAQSSGEVRLSGNVPAPVGDVAIRVQNVGTAALVTPKLNLLLP